MSPLSIPLLLARPLLRPKKLYGIEYNRTLFGVHVPRQLDKDLTETYLFAFTSQKDARDFLVELLHNRKKNGEWPSRILKRCPKHRGSGLKWTYNKSKISYDVEQATSEGLTVCTLEAKKILCQCALSGMLLRIGKKLPDGTGFVFESDNMSFWRVNKNQIICYLMGLILLQRD